MLKTVFQPSWPIRLVLPFLALAALALPAAADTDYAPMKPFEAYAGKTWRGTGTSPDGGTITDISHWEYILGGRALQATHALADGGYGGRTIFFFNEKEKEYRFHYFTTGGFYTEGTFTLDGDTMTAIENVSGHKEITKVRSTTAFEDGKMRVKSEYLKNGEWTPGHSFVYEEAPDEKVVFTQNKSKK